MFIIFVFSKILSIKELINLKRIDGANILDTLNCAAISERFFTRSRAWFTQRLNNNIVNGKPASFTSEELLRLRGSLKVIASEITKFSSNIPNIPTEMSIKVYVVNDPIAIEIFQNNDVEGFKEYLSNEEYLDFGELHYFDTEAEALAFSSGISFGIDDYSIVGHYPLRSCEVGDIAFIEAIKNH